MRQFPPGDNVRGLDGGRDRRGGTSAALMAVLALVTSVSAPVGQQGPIQVHLNNSADATTTFDVSALEAPASAAVELSDGRRGSVDVGSAGLSTNSPGEAYYRSVTLPESATDHGRYSVEPNGSERLTVEEFPDRSAVVVVVSQGDRTLEWVSASCRGNLVFLEVTMRWYGTDAAYNCQV